VIVICSMCAKLIWPWQVQRYVSGSNNQPLALHNHCYSTLTFIENRVTEMWRWKK